MPLLKRARDDNDDDDEQSQTKKPRLDALHPYSLLTYLIETVLPKRSSNDDVRVYYKAQLDDPEAAIDECKSLLADWVVRMYERGVLYDFEELKKKAASQLPAHGAIYLNLISLIEGVRRYAGQSENVQKRVNENHNSVVYRRTHFSLQYFLLDRAKESHFLLPVSDPDLKPGPIMNILEQWIALIFRCLQKGDLEYNMASESFKRIPFAELGLGANLREPLAQGLKFNAFPMRRHIFKNSSDSLKREYWQESQDREMTTKREVFLEGDYFQGSFWNAPGFYNTSDYEFQIWSVKFRVGKSHIDRFEPESIKVLCELRPDGSERHPETVIKGMFSPKCFNDPALRLGIQISGIRKCDQQEGEVWIKMDGDSSKSIPRINRLVDWLDGLDTDELRPRRWYPANTLLGREKGLYVPHPLEKNFPSLRR